MKTINLVIENLVNNKFSVIENLVNNKFSKMDLFSQPEILELLTTNLNLDDVNNFRIANRWESLTGTIKFHFNHHHQNVTQTITLTDEFYEFLKQIASGGSYSLWSSGDQAFEVQKIKLLLDLRNQLDSERLGWLNRLLGDYAYKGNEEIVELLIKAGVDLNKAYNYEPPLISAVIGNRIKIVELLIKDGANLNVRDYDYDYNPNHTALYYAIKKGYQIIVEMLLSAGADPNIYVKNSPLHLAIKNQKYEIIDLLILAGANLEDINEDGLTPFDMAIELPDKNIISKLVLAGATK